MSEINWRFDQYVQERYPLTSWILNTEQSTFIVEFLLWIFLSITWSIVENCGLAMVLSCDRFIDSNEGMCMLCIVQTHYMKATKLLWRYPIYFWRKLQSCQSWLFPYLLALTCMQRRAQYAEGAQRSGKGMRISSISCPLPFFFFFSLYTKCF